MPLVGVIQEGHILVVRGVTAGVAYPSDPIILLQERERHIVVLTAVGAASAAVLEEDLLRRAVA